MRKRTGHEHEWKEFHLTDGEARWPARECQCGARQVLSEGGWVDDDWSNWEVEVWRKD